MRIRVSKRIVCALLVVCIPLAFCSCGAAKEESTAKTSLIDDVFEAGSISVTVPQGWKAFNTTSLLNNNKSQKNDYRICVFKGATGEGDMHLFPGMMITNHEKSGVPLPNDEKVISNYDNYVEMEDVTIGDYTWHAYSVSSSGLPITTLWLDSGTKVSVVLWTSTENGEISFEDSDVKDIICSISVHEDIN